MTILTPGSRNLMLLEQLARELDERGAEVAEVLVSMIQVATSFQPYEEGIEKHLRRISIYVGLLARASGMRAREAARLQAAAVFHDVGMTIVPREMLRASGELTPEAREVIRSHPVVGRDMLSGRGVPLLDLAAELAGAHHERFDGTGYPHGLSGESIPLSARIATIADVFDALTTSSAHKMAYPIDAALDIMREGAGRHFDPALLEAFLAERVALEELIDEESARQESFQVSERDRREGREAKALGKRYYTCPFCTQIHPRELWMCPTSGHELRAIHRMSGLILNQKYLLHRAIGAGGMAAVYEARNLMTERRVAIKLLDISQCDAVTHTRFLNEARVFARVGHRNLVEILDVERTAEGHPYLVMELLEGGDLEQLLQTYKPLTESRAATITLELLKTLEAVHGAGIVHRDLKPSNIFFTHSPRRLKLLDFGIALNEQEQGSRRRLTDDNTFVGTPQYMSPEQAFSRPDIDARSDLFTVGSLLYEMVTGEPVFDGPNTMAIMMRVVNGQFASARELRPELSEGMLAILDRALQLDREERYPSAAAFAEDLRAFLEGAEDPPDVDESVQSATPSASSAGSV